MDRAAGASDPQDRALGDLASPQPPGRGAGLWIAAWAAEHSAPLATRGLKHFEGIPEVELIGY